MLVIVSSNYLNLCQSANIQLRYSSNKSKIISMILNKVISYDVSCFSLSYKFKLTVRKRKSQKREEKRETVTRKRKKIIQRRWRPRKRKDFICKDIKIKTISVNFTCTSVIKYFYPNTHFMKTIATIPCFQINLYHKSSMWLQNLKTSKYKNLNKSLDNYTFHRI